MLGHKFDRKISRVSNIKMILLFRNTYIHKFSLDAFALKGSVANVLKDVY